MKDILEIILDMDTVLNMICMIPDTTPVALLIVHIILDIILKVMHMVYKDTIIHLIDSSLTTGMVHVVLDMGTHGSEYDTCGARNSEHGGSVHHAYDPKNGSNYRPGWR